MELAQQQPSRYLKANQTKDVSKTVENLIQTYEVGLTAIPFYDLF